MVCADDGVGSLEEAWRLAGGCAEALFVGFSRSTDLVVDCEQMADLDITGAEEIVALSEELQAAEVELWLARLHGDAVVTAEKAGVIDAIGKDQVLPTIRTMGQIRAERETDSPGADVSEVDESTES